MWVKFSTSPRLKLCNSVTCQVGVYSALRFISHKLSACSACLAPHPGAALEEDAEHWLAAECRHTMGMRGDDQRAVQQMRRLLQPFLPTGEASHQDPCIIKLPISKA